MSSAIVGTLILSLLHFLTDREKKVSVLEGFSIREKKNYQHLRAVQIV